MNKFIPLGAVVAIAVVLWLVLMGSQKADNLPADGWRQYSTSTFSASYPPGYVVEEGFVHDIVPGQQAFGVAFTIDPAVASGTNLGTDTKVSIENIPTLSSCNPAAYLDGARGVETVVEDGKSYAVASSSGAGAGNFYEEIVYVRTDNMGPCPAVRYLIHTTNLANYPEGAVVEYDRAALLEEFDKIRLSLQTK